MKPTDLVKTVRGLFFFGTLVRNPDKLDSVFEMRDAMTSPELVRPIADALRARHPAAAAAFRERPRLGRIDVTALAKMPAHTLGGTYGRFLRKNGLDPESIPTLSADEDWEYMSAHLYETHDLWHVLTGFGVDVAGEGGLQAFYAAQIPGPLASALLSAILLNNAMVSSDVETHRRMDRIAEGWAMGKRAQSLFGFRFADRFGDSLEDIRRELDIVALAPNVGAEDGTNVGIRVGANIEAPPEPKTKTNALAALHRPTNQRRHGSPGLCRRSPSAYRGRLVSAPVSGSRRREATPGPIERGTHA